MSIRFRVLALVAAVSLLAGGCGGSEPATNRVPPVDTTNLSPTETPVPPTTTAVAPASSAVPTKAPAARAMIATDTPSPSQASTTPGPTAESSQPLASRTAPNSNAPVAAGPVVDVPLGSPPILDGVLEPDEWAGTFQDKLSDGGELFLTHDGKYLYVGLRAGAKGSGVGSICIDRGGQVAILHSSAALGTAIYERQGAEWQQIQDFSWRCRDTGSSAAAQRERSAFLEAEGWLANNGRMGVPEEVEYQIAIPEGPLRLAVAFLGSPSFDSVAAWPRDLGDDCRNIKLITGPTPQRLQFSPQTWTSVSPAAASSMAPGDVTRTVVTYGELMNGSPPNSPVDEVAFLMPEAAAPSERAFEGRLELFGEDTNGGIEILRGDLGPEAAHLPEFDYAFVQSGSYLVPAKRGQIIADHPNWNVIIGPGRVWKENGDQGYSRASFPFALVWKGSNATFNGTMTFLFDEMNVSRVWYQITQETTSYTRANFWGLLEAAYHPEPVPDAAQIRAAFDQELADRFPTQSIDQLAQDYPGVDVSAFGRGVSPEHRTMYGFVINGVDYVGECRTRAGPYAYCDWMRATSYSTAKSAFVSVALMRLAQEYGPEVAGLLIKDFVPEYAQSPGDWERVTFNHTIDMATGNYRSAGYMTDEDGQQMGEYWDAQPYANRIAAAFDWPHSAEPGTQWVYRTSDTFILTRALHNYVQSQEGPAADIFEYVVKEVYEPLRIGPGAHTTMRTADDNWQGQPEGGYGLWWIQDDIAKIATLLHNGGKLNGEQLLHPDLLAAAMQQDPNDRGVDIDRRRKYNNAFWAQSYGPADVIDCDIRVPQMLGVSGNVVALMPNGSTYYYFSDNQEFTWDAAVRESNKIVPHCP
ncbi:MAG: hypothetical protein P8189_12050 [Anaerolineae bacterium]